ncbi:hypothetical protein LUZ60_004250 [Juncus effusus]|nr:hypothetical protein LUZ60_004250 [Juncus effusus]
MALVLHAGQGGKNSYKSLIAAEYSGVKAQIEQWLDFAATEIDDGITRWIDPSIGFSPHCAHSVQLRVASLKKALRILDTHLAGTCYLVGHGVTLADIVMVCTLHFGFTHIMTKSFTSEFPHVERYLWMLVNLPNFKKILGEVKQVESVPAMPQLTMMVNQMIEAQKKWSVSQIIQKSDVA